MRIKHSYIMKKYLLTFCLLALVHVAFGFEQDTLSSKDSVIVEFGSSCKIIMSVDNKVDFERLKMMDGSQIIRALDLELDYESGESTIVELKDKDGAYEVVKTDERGPTTKGYVGRWRVIVDDTGNKNQVKVESGPKKKKEDPDFRTYFNMDLGVNNYFENKAVPGERAVHGVKG